MSEDNTGRDEDGFADAMAALALITVVIISVVVWLSSM